MSRTGLSHGARLACYALAIGVHAAAAAAFMLTPKIESPPAPEGVEIELLAEITMEAAEEVPPSVAAQSMEAEQASEAQPGEAQTVPGEQVEAVASLDVKQTEVTPDEVEETEKPQDQPQAEETPEAKPIEDPNVATPVEPPEEAVGSPVELEKPVIEAPQAPVLAKKPKPAAKKEKKAKAQKQRAAVVGSTLSKDAKRKGASRAATSGGNRSSAEYRSIVNARLAARRSAIQARAGSGVKGRVVISFTIGSGGSVVSASVSQSSGNARLDSAARAMVASTSFPPPPGGHFRNGVPIVMK